jgi:hypothetical protein
MIPGMLILSRVIRAFPGILIQQGLAFFTSPLSSARVNNNINKSGELRHEHGIKSLLHCKEYS